RVNLQGLVSGDLRTSIDAVASAVQGERPNLPRLVGAAPDGTVTILFTDIEGSTTITERLGDQRWLGLLHTHNAIIREQLAAHAGFEVKSQGDGFMAAFQSARRALQCAIAIQQSLASYNNQHPEEPIRVRCGLHTGEAIKEADDFFGKSVILAARIAAQAQGGQILVSGLLKELTESSGQFKFDQGREIELKGLSGLQRMFELEWQNKG
ncbi:MAG: adenylate/guanylate cyclase domain-containing protein, partial [Chloroflexota bacterium]